MLPSPVTFGGERAAPRRRAPARKEAPVSAGPRLLPEAEERQCRTESNRTEPNRAEPNRAGPAAAARVVGAAPPPAPGAAPGAEPRRGGGGGGRLGTAGLGRGS